MLRLLFIWATLAAAADEPRLLDAKPVIHPAAGLEREFRSLVSHANEPLWIGWEVPVAKSARRSRNGCGQDGGEQRGPLRLEGERTMIVLFRVDAAKVEKIRTVSPDCEIDAGGIAFHWFSGVSAGESVRQLASLVMAGDKQRNKVNSAAISAISLHDDPAAFRFIADLLLR